MSAQHVACLAVAIAALAPSVAVGAETWQDVKPGIQYLHRTTTNPPQSIHATKIDLQVPNVGLYAAADAIGTERRVNTRTFAQNAGTIVAINGDWSDGTTPIGLAISNGRKWHDHIGDNTVGGHWGFMGCTVDKKCTLSRELPLDQAWWFGEPTRAPYRFYQAIGANGITLLEGGQAGSGCYDSARNPRSAACVDAGGRYLWLVVIDGRQSDASGMTCDETRTLLLSLGCHDAVMLDGGGSSTLVVNGEVQNSPSDGSPRTLGSHFGIIYSDTIDARCRSANALWCDGTTIASCQGGRFMGSGDCAAYGAGCQEDGDHAFCVHPDCPGGDGMGSVCTDATRFTKCNDGALSEGDCGAFGLVCGTDASGAGCMEPACEAGPNGSFCTDDGAVGECTDGSFTQNPCPEDTVCEVDAEVATCIDPAAEPSETDAGNPSDAGHVDQPDADRRDASPGTPGDATGSDLGSDNNLDEDASPNDVAGRGSCSHAAGGPLSLPFLVIFSLLVGGRARRRLMASKPQCSRGSALR